MAESDEIKSEMKTEKSSLINRLRNIIVRIGFFLLLFLFSPFILVSMIIFPIISLSIFFYWKWEGRKKIVDEIRSTTYRLKIFHEIDFEFNLLDLKRKNIKPLLEFISFLFHFSIGTISAIGILYGLGQLPFKSFLNHPLLYLILLPILILLNAIIWALIRSYSKFSENNSKNLINFKLISKVFSIVFFSAYIPVILDGILMWINIEAWIILFFIPFSLQIW